LEGDWQDFIKHCTLPPFKAVDVDRSRAHRFVTVVLLEDTCVTWILHA
jgi:hypothetical protein